MHVCVSEIQRDCAFVYMCMHVVSMCNRCEINKPCCGVENVLQVATHLFNPPPSRSDLIAENVINTADGVFVIVNALGEMKPIPDRCVYGVPWCRRISQLFTGDHNYRLRNQEMCPPPLLFFMNYRHYFYLHVDRGGICVIYSFAFPLFWNFTLINSLMVSNDD